MKQHPYAGITRLRTLSSAAALALATALSTLAPPAVAGTASSTFQVTATLISACVVSGNVLNFGAAIDPLVASVPVDATSTLTVTCTNTTSYSVALDAGVNAGGAASFASRQMKAGSNLLGYQLYANAGRTTVWGDGSGSSSAVAGTGSGSNQSLTIYGRLPTLAGAVPGSYADTVTVTVTY